MSLNKLLLSLKKKKDLNEPDCHNCVGSNPELDILKSEVK